MKKSILLKTSLMYINNHANITIEIATRANNKYANHTIV